MHSVAVIMSTYNGDRYIEEQIMSIQNQEDIKVDIYIRDDGSKDRTIQIVKELMNQSNNIYFSEGSNLGVGNSFMTCLYNVPNNYDYYAFSDQDDVWMKNKLIAAIKEIERHEVELYCSNQLCVDSVTGREWYRYKETPELTVYDILCHNTIAGCTMVMSNYFKRMITEKQRRPSPELLKTRIHDVWIIAIAALLNSVYYDNNSYIYYRQHNNNVVGSSETSYRYRFTQFKKKLFNEDLLRGRSKLAKELVYRYGDRIEKSSPLRLCADYSSMRSRVLLITHRNRIKDKQMYVLFCLYVLCGLY